MATTRATRQGFTALFFIVAILIYGLFANNPPNEKQIHQQQSNISNSRPLSFGSSPKEKQETVMVVFATSLGFGTIAFILWVSYEVKRSHRKEYNFRKKIADKLDD